MAKTVMTKQEIFDKLAEVLTANFEIEASAVKTDAKLFEDLGLDSIDAVDMIVKMKEYTTKKIEPDAFKGVKTVQDVVDVLFQFIN